MIKCINVYFNTFYTLKINHKKNTKFTIFIDY